MPTGITGKQVVCSFTSWLFLFVITTIIYSLHALSTFTHWRFLSAAITIIYFLLIPLPKQLAQMRREACFLVLGILALLCQLLPAIQEAWASFVSPPTHTYSVVRVATSLFDERHVWLVFYCWPALVCYSYGSGY